MNIQLSDRTWHLFATITLQLSCKITSQSLFQNMPTWSSQTEKERPRSFLDAPRLEARMPRHRTPVEDGGIGGREEAVGVRLFRLSA